MGNVNVVLNSGKVVSVPEEDAKLLERNEAGHVESGGESFSRSSADVKEHDNSDLGSKAATYVEGLNDTVTGGLWGKAVEAMGGEEVAQEMRNRAEVNPGTRLAGELTGFALPGATTAAKGLGEAVVEGTGSKVLGRAAEGSLLGVGGTVAQSNVTGDPLTVEALVEGAGIGGLINIGAGALGDGLVGFGNKRLARAAETEAAEKASAVFENSPGYNELREARASVDAESAEVNRGAAKYRDYLENPQAMDRTADGMQRAINELRAETMGSGGPLARQVTELEDRMAGVRSLLKQGDAQAADVAMRDLYGSISRTAGDLGVPVANKIPMMPAMLSEVERLGVKLPGDLKGFARMHPDDVARVANAMKAPEKQALGKLMGELGLQPTENAAADLAGVHATLREQAEAIDRLEQQSAPGPLGKMLKYAGKKAGAAAGAAFGGGFVGHMIGSAVGEQLVAAALESRAAIQRAITATAKLAVPTGKALREIGPIAAYLSRSFPSGKKDRETDLGQLAKNRIREIAAAAATAPDTLYAAVKPAIGVPGDIALKTHQHALGALQHLAVNMPRDPGNDPHGTKSDWKPSPQDAIALAYRLEVLQDPIGAMKRMLAGDAHPAAADALRANWPASTAELLGEFMNEAPDAQTPALTGVSALSGTPLTAGAVGANAVAIQGMYLPGASEQRQAPEAGPPGRPPKAGRGGVAGSNVTALLNDGM